MRRSLRIALASAAIGLGSVAAQGQSTTFATAGDNTTILFGGTQPGTSASLFLTLTGEDNAANTFTFSYTLTNTSSLVVNPTSRVRAFGFDDIGIDATTGSATTADSNGFDRIVFDQGFPSIADREFCLFNNPGNCNGGNSGATVGDSATGSFTLDYAGSGLTQITLGSFAVRFQSTGTSGQGSGVGEPVPAVPEPGTWAMMLLGFGGIGYSIRRRRKVGTIAQLA